MYCQAVLMVANLSCDVDVSFLTHLFSTYADVLHVTLHGSNEYCYAYVGVRSTDDADVAIASLHLNYYTAPNLPLIVLYGVNSPNVSDFGYSMASTFVSTIGENRLARGSSEQSWVSSYDVEHDSLEESSFNDFIYM